MFDVAMTQEEIRLHSGFVQYAKRMLDYLDHDGKEVEICVERFFEGNWSDFAESAHSFLSDGFGVKG